MSYHHSRSSSRSQLDFGSLRAPVHRKISIRGKILEGSQISLLTILPSGGSTIFAYQFPGSLVYGELNSPPALEYDRVIIFEIYYVTSGIQLKVINGALAGYYLTALHTLEETPITLIPQEEGTSIRPVILYAGTRYSTRLNGNNPLYLVPMEMKYYNFIKDGQLKELNPRYGPLALWSYNPEGVYQEDRDLIADPTGVCLDGNDWINSNSSGCFFTSMVELEEGFYYNYCKNGDVCGDDCVGYCADGECHFSSRSDQYP
jgi:hypothetical protein